MSVEAAFFSSNPFLRSLNAFVRREIGADGDAGAVSCEKPPSLSCLSPEVTRRLRFVNNAATAAASSAVTGEAPAGLSAMGEEGEGFFLFGEEGRVQQQWSLVKTAEKRESEGEEDALAEGARLAVACHASLRRTHQRQQKKKTQASLLPREEETSDWPQRAAGRQSNKLDTSELPFADALPGVIERILGAESNEEEVYVGFCVCLIILERALYDIYRQRASSSSSKKKSNAPGQHGGGVQAHGEGSESVGAPLVAPAMILRDLIATPEVEAALPEQMLALLRLLLLPMGFNIRNLVWHGFLAPRELPRELASLVLLLTTLLSFPVDSSSEEEARETTDVECVGEGTGSPPPPSPPPPPPPQPKTALHTEPQRASWWALDSFDDRLACPQVLTSAVESLLSEQHREELDSLMRRSAFVLPGREGVAILGLRALGDGRSGRRNSAFFLVALLPVLEHGLRCLFSCANGSPGHLFAHLRQYYSTLDGFGQRAKHQLLLDQTLSGYPDRKNLLLAALGPGLSAVLLDLFMMSAGPNLRGKVAHGEIDMAGVLSCSQTASLPPSSSFCSPSDSGTSCSEGAGTTVGGPDIVMLTAAVFLVLCRRHYPGSGVLVRPGGTEGIAGNSGSSDGNPNGSSPPPMFSDAFVQALDAADASCSRWVPRFHPHELLEADLQDCRDDFDGLAVALERRMVSVDVLPGGDLARMTVVVLGGGLCCSGDTPPPGTWKGAGNKEGNPPSSQSVYGEGGGQGGDGEGRQTQDDASSLFDRRLVLTVTDSASRLIPDAATSGGIYPGLARVDEALRVHSLSLADRFKRSAARSQRRETGTGTPTSTPTPTPTSAFATHYCSQPAAVSSCGVNGAAVNDNKVRRNNRRISPPTNVITASPLPQVSCVSGLCRACAEVARGLRDRLVELEALLAVGSARSKQRRAYATIVRVAPALLRFLASTVAAVELFVVEWDQRATPPSAGEEAVTHAAEEAVPPDSAAGLSFLRRLAAVNGTLCVTPPGECSAKVVVGPGSRRSAAAGKDSCGEGATCKKKGFAQALAELASFLETKTARQGFARRSS